MNRILLSAVLLVMGGLFVGCDQKDTTSSETKVSTPSGTETKKVTVEDKKSGDMKDNAAGAPGTAPATAPH
jgi:hypothetical protein